MIILKLWMTERKAQYYPTKKPGYRKYWKGYFLFGILPLYIENQKTEYYE